MKSCSFLTGIVCFLLSLLACEESTFSPSQPSPLPPPVAVSSPQPRVDQPFSWDSYQGYVFFGAGSECQSDEELVANVQTMLALGWNTPQILAESEFWDEGCGHYPRKPRNLERLREILDLLARVPGVQVALVGNGTLKRQIPLLEQEDWALQVADVANDFENVAVFTHNEWANCRGRDDWGGSDAFCPGKEDIRRHIQIYRAAGVEYVTADDSVGPRTAGDSEAKTFTFRMANIGAYPASFHPSREHKGQPWDPDVKYLTKLAQYNGLFVLSETVAIMDYSGNCSGLRTCSNARIEQYIADCASVPECKFTLHSENLLAGEPPSWIPQAR